MSAYTVISGTNREGSKSMRVAEAYQEMLCERGISAHLLSLAGLNVLEPNKDLADVEQHWIIPARKFIFIIPEYNGSFPGVLKAFLDCSDIDPAWAGKKALLTGISKGRAGNLRGLEHLTGILHFLKVSVHHNKLPISGIHKLLDDRGRLNDAATLGVIREQVDEFIQF